MNPKDLELITHISPRDPVLNELYTEHVDYEKQLAKLDNKLFLTPREIMLRKELQKKKLKGRDKIEVILLRYRKEDQQT